VCLDIGIHAYLHASIDMEDERRKLVAKMNWLWKIRGRSRGDKIRNKTKRKELGPEITLGKKSGKEVV